MIRIIDHEGNGYGAQAEITRRKGVNGEKSLTGVIYTNEEVLHGVDRGWKLEFENEMYAFTFAYPKDIGNRIELEFDAVHEFFYDMSKNSQNNLLNDGSHTFKTYLDFIFKDTGYNYRLDVDVKAFEKQSFGQRNRLDLFYDVIDTAGVEFSVNGSVVRIIERVGNDLSTVVKKGFNLNELRLEKNIGNFVTYQKGFGAWNDDEDHSKGRLEVEYLSPLAEIYGKLDADPVVDERYTNKSNLENRLKSNVEGSYQISVQIDMEDLTRAGYEYKQPHEGDSIMAINNDLGFQRKVRIVSYETDFDVEGNILDHRITCNSVGMVEESILSNNSIKNSIKELQTDLELTRKQVIEFNVSADGKSTNYYGPIEPSPDEYKLGIGDTWFDTSGEDTIVKVWNGVEWRKSGADVDAIRREIEQAQVDIEAAQATADEAVNRINGEIAGKFNDIDTEISQVHQDAQNALNQAGDAVSQVAYFGETLDGFTQTVANIDGRVANIRQDVDGITQTVTDHTGKIATVEQNVNGIQQTVSDPVNGLVTQVSTLANGFNVLAKDFADMEIGGRNLVLDSDFLSDKNINLSGVNELISLLNSFEYITLSADIEVKNVLSITTNNRIGFELGVRYEDDTIGVFTCFVRGLNIGDSFEGRKTNTTQRTKKIKSLRHFQTVIQVDAEKSLAGRPKIEKGTKATDWTPAPEDMATQAQLSVLNDNINLRVTKGELLSQINIEAGRTLIQSDKLLLDANNVVFTGTAWIPSSVIGNLEADKITSGTLDGAKARIINLDFDTAVGNRTEFVQSAWNNAVGGNVSISGSGIVTTSSNGAQGLIQNGVFLARRPEGSTVGYIGYDQSNGPSFQVTTSLGAHFKVRNHLGNEVYKNLFTLETGGTTARFNVDQVLNNSGKFRAYEFEGRYGGRFYSTSGYQTRLYGSNDNLYFLVGTDDWAGRAFRMNTTRNFSYKPLNMDGNEILSSPSISDERLKNVHGIRTDNDLEKLMQIEYVNFKWKNEEYGGEDLGFVAQQVQSIVPEMMMENKDGFLGYNQQTYLNFVGHSVQQLALREENTNKIASQALQATETNAQKIERLEKRIEELEGVA